MHLKKILHIISFLIITPIWAQNHSNDSLSVNSELNDQYLNSVKLIKGKLNKEEYKKIKIRIEDELNTKIPDGKDILINFYQKAPNCLVIKFRDEVVMSTINNSVNISTKLCLEHNAVDFFVFSKKSFNSDLYETKKQFRLDSGFFYNNIFTLHDNCCAFFILKSDGKFYKYYGEDYFSEVKKYL